MTHVEQEEGGWQRHTNASTAASFHFSSQTQLDSSTSKTSAKKPAATSLSSMTPPIVGGFNAKFQDTAAIDAMEIDILRKRLSEVAAERHQISIELTRARQMVK